MYSSMNENDELRSFIENLNIKSAEIFSSYSEVSRYFWL